MLVRKSSDEGSAAAISTCGGDIDCASTFLFLLKVVDLVATAGSGGTSDSADGLVVEAALSFCLFLDRKRFIVGRWTFALQFETVPYRREPIRH